MLTAAHSSSRRIGRCLCLSASALLVLTSTAFPASADPDPRYSVPLLLQVPDPAQFSRFERRKWERLEEAAGAIASKAADLLNGTFKYWRFEPVDETDAEECLVAWLEPKNGEWHLLMDYRFRPGLRVSPAWKALVLEAATPAPSTTNRWHDLIVGDSGAAWQRLIEEHNNTIFQALKEHYPLHATRAEALAWSEPERRLVALPLTQTDHSHFGRAALAVRCLHQDSQAEQRVALVVTAQDLFVPLEPSAEHQLLGRVDQYFEDDAQTGKLVTDAQEVDVIHLKEVAVYLIAERASDLSLASPHVGSSGMVLIP